MRTYEGTSYVSRKPQYQNFKSQQHQLGTSNHRDFPAAHEGILLYSIPGETLNLVIFTESLSSLMNLKENNNAYNDPDVYRILSTISELQEKGKKVSLVLVPAHAGIPGNDQAAPLAKTATTKDTTECWIPDATIKDVKRIIDQNPAAIWQTRWEDKI